MTKRGTRKNKDCGTIRGVRKRNRLQGHDKFEMVTGNPDVQTIRNVSVELERRWARDTATEIMGDRWPRLRILRKKNVEDRILQHRNKKRSRGGKRGEGMQFHRSQEKILNRKAYQQCQMLLRY